MAWRLPPLNAIRAFEAAGRHQSFTLAADELHVTPGAISRQIKTLEKVLGIPLFARAHREVRLTAEAQAYFDAVRDALRLIDNATNRLLDARRERPLRVMCSVLFAMRWLFPRLPRFHLKHPQIQLSLTTALTTLGTEFDSDSADVVIRLGDGRWGPEVASYRLFDSQLVAMCSPKLLEEGPSLRSLADLRHHLLLYSVLRPDTWPRWLKAAGAPAVDLSKATKFESSALTYQAAIEGLGVALGERGFIGEDLKRGRLVVPFEFAYSSSEAFYLICQRHAERTANLRAFRLWMIEEARLLRDALGQTPSNGEGLAQASAIRGRPKSASKRA